MMRKCDIEGCTKPIRARGWCYTHWARWRRRGSPHIVLPNHKGPLKYKTLKECVYSGISNLHPAECWEWEKGISQIGGYGQLWWDKKHYKAHRASWIVHNGEIPLGLMVCHKCDNTKCINPSHLFLGSSLDNNRDRKLKGRNADISGERNPFSKLKNKQVLIIKERIKNGENIKLISNDFNVSYYTIWSIKAGINWKNIGE